MPDDDKGLGIEGPGCNGCMMAIVIGALIVAIGIGVLLLTSGASGHHKKKHPVTTSTSTSSTTVTTVSAPTGPLPPATAKTPPTTSPIPTTTKPLVVPRLVTTTTSKPIA